MAIVKSTAARTATVTVNAAFFQEIKEVNQELYDLLKRVRERLAEHREKADSSGRHSANGRQLADLLAELRDQLALHFALEEAYGYFEDPVFVAPRLGEQAATLRKDHRRLYLQISDLVDYVERLVFRGRPASAWSQVQGRFEQFHEQLQTHEARENELILQAYDDDIGVGD